MSLPAITIQGNAVSDPQLTFTPQGAARCSFRIAANDRKKNESGEWVDGDTTFLSVTVWRNLAETVAESVTKGTPVVVIGRLKSRTVEDAERGKATYYDVEADTVAVDLRRGAVKPTGSSYAPANQSSAASSAEAWAAAIRPLSDSAPF